MGKVNVVCANVRLDLSILRCNSAIFVGMKCLSVMYTPCPLLCALIKLLFDLCFFNENSNEVPLNCPTSEKPVFN